MTRLVRLLLRTGLLPAFIDWHWSRCLAEVTVLRVFGMPHREPTWRHFLGIDPLPDSWFIQSGPSTSGRGA